MYTCLGVLLMATTMALYNKYLVYGTFSREVFRQTAIAFCQKAPIAFVLQFFFVQKFVGKQCAKYPTDNKLVYYAIRTGFTVLVMCPIMSFVSNLTLMIQLNWSFSQLLSNWIPKMVVNWIFAYFVQIFMLGPVNRMLFGFIFPQKRYSMAE